MTSHQERWGDGLLPRIEKEVERIAEDYPGTQAESLPNGHVLVIVPKCPLPSGWNKKNVDVLLNLPPTYPNDRPIFLTDASLLLENGNKPGGAGGNASLLDHQWMSFCWNPKIWDMSRDSLWRFLKFGLSRFKELQ
jgi:hypothetical protein